MDKENLLPGEKWDPEIKEVIKCSDLAFVFFSKTSLEKYGYVQNEYKIILECERNKPPRTIFIIPFRLDRCEIPRAFQDKYSVDLFDKSRDEQKKNLQLAINSWRKKRGA